MPCYLIIDRSALINSPELIEHNSWCYCAEAHTGTNDLLSSGMNEGIHGVLGS